jgi:hypothetical protein
LSARKVAQENERLRRLLRHVGVNEGTINSWADENGTHDGEGLLKRPCLRKAGGGDYGQANANLEDSRQEERNEPGETTVDAPSDQACLSCPAKMGPRDCNSSVRNENSETANKPSMLENGQPVDNAALISSDPPVASASHTTLGSTPISDNPLKPTPPAPCKLLTHLTVNPSADITQMPIASAEMETIPDIMDDGIPCSRAYQMLIHYATTETKLDAVAHVLEEGCVPNVAPGGGCRVKSKAIWKALDDMCL